jgi:ABC-2 type transport system permease protein
MKPFLAILSARFRMMLQYRAAALAGLWTQCFFGLVMVMVYESFYVSSGRAQPMNLSQVISYVWLGQALLAVLPWNVDIEIRGMVRSGAIAYELCRPVDLYNLWYARAMAWRTAPAVLRAVPMVLIATLLLPALGLGDWRLRLPMPLAGLSFAAAIGCTVLLSSAITTLVNISLLWTIAGEGVNVLLMALVTLLSGMIVPLPLFPTWAQPILMLLPFAGLVDLPYRIYNGNIAPGSVPWVLLHQLVWTGVLVLLGRWLLARGMRRVVVQGG